MQAITGWPTKRLQFGLVFGMQIRPNHAPVRLTKKFKSVPSLKDSRKIPSSDFTSLVSPVNT